MLRFLLSALAILAWLSPVSAASLDTLLARDAPPPGVVFEIADRDPQALDHALPWVKQAAQQLKARFPGMPMALVAHGREMFALQTAQREGNATTHRLAESLVRDEGIPLHVCEAHAGWRGVAPEAFPAYVDVAPTGPAQIRNYEALDYVRLVVPPTPTLK